MKEAGDHINTYYEVEDRGDSTDMQERTSTPRGREQMSESCISLVRVCGGWGLGLWVDVLV